MWFLNGTPKHWSLTSSGRTLKNLAQDSMVQEPEYLPLLEQVKKGNIPDFFVRGAEPAAYLHAAELNRLISGFIADVLGGGRVTTQTFETELSSRLNRFNAYADLPPIGRCLLIDGRQGYCDQYTVGRYNFADGNFSFHYQIDSRNFAGAVAHELTHLEQDYLAICLLADYLKIEVECDFELLEDLAELMDANRDIKPSHATIKRFLKHRNGRRLNQQQKTRAEAILTSFRARHYMRIVKQDQMRAEALAPYRSWLSLSSYLSSPDYSKFWDSIVANKDKLPEGLKNSFKDILLKLDQEDIRLHQKTIGKNFYRLLRYYAEDAADLLHWLNRLWQRHLFFEREAYAVSDYFKSEFRPGRY